MLNLLFPLPKSLIVAFSGGVDSVAVVDFLSRKHNVTCAFFHHGTENSERALHFVSDFCQTRNLNLLLGWANNDKPSHMSKEEYWRIERYKFLDQCAAEAPVITAHHLDDCVETYIWSALHGTPKVVSFKRNNILRPFLTTPKHEFVSWCERKNLQWCEDLSNQDINFTRNYIRHELMPHALKVNPGLSKVVKKQVKKRLMDDKYMHEII